MPEAQKRPGEEQPVVTSAAQLRGLSWEGVRRTALDVVENFCQRNGLNPGEFMANLGMMRSEQWRQNVNWRECVNWNNFNSLIFSSIPAEMEGGSVVGRRFEQGRLTSTLRDMQESYVASATPRTEDRAAQRPAAQQRESAPVPRQEERPAERPASEQRASRPSAPARQEPRTQTTQTEVERAFTDRLVRRGYSPEQATEILGIVQQMRSGQDVALNPRQSLWQSDINEINNAWSRVSPSTQTVSQLGTSGMTQMFLGLLLRGPGQGRVPQPREETQIAETTRPAPARQETYTYTVSYGVLDMQQNTFTVVSNTPLSIYSETPLAAAMRNPPEGFVVMENGVPVSQERRLALAQDIEMRSKDPLGTFAITRATTTGQRRGG
ncbi:MAG: hypothetical protein V1861_03715 [Candidatus Micrarchaeota archaeon]